MKAYYMKASIKKTYIKTKTVLLLSTALLLSVCYFNIHAHNNEEEQGAPTRARIQLTSKALKFIDGIKGAMDEYKIRDVMYIGREINKIQFGAPDPRNKSLRIGTFKHKEQLYTLKDIVKLETEYLCKNPNTDPLKSSLIKDLFEKAAFSFRDTVKPYLSEAKRFKKLTLELINEYCTKAKKPNSYLLTWQEGDNEQEIFRKYVKSSKDLDTFCSELTDFMSTMIHNCPKGYKKYLDWKAKQRN